MKALFPGPATPSAPPPARRAPEGFDHLLPRNQVWFSVPETALILGCSEQHVRDCFLSRKLLGHRSNGNASPGHERRHRLHIRREGILLYLAETANYDFTVLRDRVQELLRFLPPDDLRSLRQLLPTRDSAPASRVG